MFELPCFGQILHNQLKTVEFRSHNLLDFSYLFIGRTALLVCISQFSIGISVACYHAEQPAIFIGRPLLQPATKVAI